MGQLLVANPSNPRDSFEESVILVVAHLEHMAVGLQINNICVEPTIQEIAYSLGIWLEGQDPVWRGGYHQMHKIHMIHSTDWQGASTVKINDDIAVTNDISVLTALSQGLGPQQFRACAGLCVWPMGELDRQLDPQQAASVAYRWETVDATAELVFDTVSSQQWRRCLEESAKRQVSSWFA